MLTVVLSATPAAAHEIWPGAPGVVSMLLHPFMTPEIVLVMAGLALLVGANERRATVLLCAPLIVAGVAIGLASQVPLLAFPGLWWWPMIVASWLGLVVASGVRVGRVATLIAALLAAVTVGLGVPRERPFVSGALEAWAGVTLALLVVLALFSVPRASAHHPLVRIAARIAGAWISAITMLGLAAAMR